MKKTESRNVSSFFSANKSIRFNASKAADAVQLHSDKITLENGIAAEGSLERPDKRDSSEQGKLPATVVTILNPIPSSLPSTENSHADNSHTDILPQNCDLTPQQNKTNAETISSIKPTDLSLAPPTQGQQRHETTFFADFSSQAFDDTPALVTKSSPFSNLPKNQPLSASTEDPVSRRTPESQYSAGNSSFLSRFRSSSAGIFSTVPRVPSPLSKVVVAQGSQNFDASQPISSETVPSSDQAPSDSAERITWSSDSATSGENDIASQANIGRGWTQSEDGRTRRNLLDQLTSGTETNDSGVRASVSVSNGSMSQKSNRTETPSNTQIVSMEHRMHQQVQSSPTATVTKRMQSASNLTRSATLPVPIPRHVQQGEMKQSAPTAEPSPSHSRGSPSAFVEKWLSPQQENTGSQVSTPITTTQKTLPGVFSPDAVDPVDPTTMDSPQLPQSGAGLSGKALVQQTAASEHVGQGQHMAVDAATDNLADAIQTLTSKSKDVLQAVSEAATDKRSCERRREELELRLAEHSAMLAMGLIDWVESWGMGAFVASSKELDRTMLEAQELLKLIQ